MKYLFALAIALSLTLVWQTASLENRASELQSVENSLFELCAEDL